MTLIMYIIGAVLLSVGQAIALSKNTDSEMPLTYYIRRFFRSFGAVGMLLVIGIWLWLGCHFILDLDGSLAC